jgi:hypothetical protein
MPAILSDFLHSRSAKFRKAAADCLSLVRTTTDPTTRAVLLVMAQRWLDQATPLADDLLRNSMAKFDQRQLAEH